jgi:hypothetical protein
MSIQRSQKSLQTLEKLQSARSVAASDHITLESYVQIVVRIMMLKRLVVTAIHPDSDMSICSAELLGDQGVVIRIQSPNMGRVNK